LKRKNADLKTEEDKRHAVFDAGRGVPRNRLITGSLEWLDRYLRPVKSGQDLRLWGLPDARRAALAKRKGLRLVLDNP